MTRSQWLALAAGVLAVSWAAPLIRLAEAPALAIAALRLGIAAPPLAALAAWRRREELRALTPREWSSMAIAGLALAAHFGAWVAAIQRTSVIAGVVLVATQPLFVALGAWVLLGERPSRQVLAGIAIAALGAVLLAGSGLEGGGSLEGDALAVLGAIFAAIYLIAGRRIRAARSNLAYVAVVDVVAALALLAAVLVSGEPLHGHPREAYLYIALLALVPQLIGHTAFTWALGSLTATVVAVAILGEPVGAVLIAAIVLDEPPTLLEWAGAGVVLAGVYLALRAPSRPGAVSTSPPADEGVDPWPAR